MAQTVKNLSVVGETWVQSLGQEDPLKKRMATPTPVFLPGKSCGQRSPAGYNVVTARKKPSHFISLHRSYYMSKRSFFYFEFSLKTEVSDLLSTRQLCQLLAPFVASLHHVSRAKCIMGHVHCHVSMPTYKHRHTLELIDTGAGFFYLCIE